MRSRKKILGTGGAAGAAPPPMRCILSHAVQRVGFFATFDGPIRAVRCAATAVAAVRDLGIQIRAGLHTGEVELDGPDVRGIAVHIGARVASLAGPSEVLVTSTVKDLVAGAALEFEDRGEHKLKGVPGAWRLYRVA